MASWRESKALGIGLAVVGGIALIVAMVFTFKPAENKMILIDTSTGEVLTKAVPEGTDFPIANSKGEKTVYVAHVYTCDDDHEFYIPLIVPTSKEYKGGEAPTPPMMEEIKCPQCGSTNVTPGNKEQSKKLKKSE